jgi:hypothetical protein
MLDRKLISIRLDNGAQRSTRRTSNHTHLPINVPNAFLALTKEIGI